MSSPREEPIRVLILEDNGSDAELMKLALRRAGLDFTADLAEDKDAFLRSLEKFLPDIILADYRLPGFDGLAALILARQTFPDIPVIIVSGAIGEEFAIETIKAGATDYVLKQRLSRLGPVVQRALREAEQRKEKQRAEEALRSKDRELQLIVDSGPTLISYVDADGRYRWVNQTYVSLFGLANEQVRGRLVREVLGESAWGVIQPYVKKALAGEVTAYENELTLQMGGKRWLLATYTPDRDEAGRVRGFVVHALDIGERKKAEASLLREKTFTDAIIDSLPGVFYLFNEQGRFLRWNKNFELVSGYSAEEMARIRPLDFFRGRDKQLVADTISKIFANGQATVEANFFSKSGTPTPFFFTGTRIVFEQTPCVVGMGVDIAERKNAEEKLRGFAADLQAVNASLRDSRRAALNLMDDALAARRTAEQASLELEREAAEREHIQEALRASEEKYRAIVETANEGIWAVDADRRTTYMNEKMAEMLGYSREEALGKSWKDFVGEEARALSNENLEKRRRGEAGSYEYKLIRKDGSALWTLVNARPRFDKAGNFLGTISLLTDITERKRMEESLHRQTLELQELTKTLERRVKKRTQELAKLNENLLAEIAERLRLVAAVEQADEGIAITDTSGRIDYTNPAFEKTSGRKGKRLLGTSYYDLLIGEASDEQSRKIIQDKVLAGEAWTGHLRRKTGDRPDHELQVSFTPIRDQAGAVTNFLAVERDVTTETRLQQNLRQLQKIEALGTLAGGIAHDFNNLLNPIFINAELALLDAPPDGRIQQYLQIVLQAAERGKELIKQIITFSRQKEKEQKPLKVEPLVKEALKFLRSSLPRTIEIRESIQKETSYILADPTQIHQVVINLCNNSAYAMREHGGVLEVSLKEAEVDEDMSLLHPGLKPGPYLRLAVADTGTGMTREVMERAFDPFFTTKKPGEGSGLGLALVHGIVKDHGGAISVYSEPGKGATFNVYFPRIKAEGPALDVSNAPPARAEGHKRILFVDDETVQVKSVQNMLERLGYEVVAKTESKEALDAFRKDPLSFDLVVTDQTMPQMTGVELAEAILRIRPDVPIVLCTGFSELVDANGAAKKGICQFLMKPFSIREMGETVRQALEKNGRRQK